LNLLKSTPVLLLACGLMSGLQPMRAIAQQTPNSAEPSSQRVLRDGQHDFDFLEGTWKIHLKRLVHPLTGSTTWTGFDGNSKARKFWDGRGSFDEFETDGPSGHIEGITVRTYNAQSHQWSLYWANGKDGAISLPATVGEFRNGAGEFYDQEPFNGRMIFVRYVWSQITPNSAHFEQSFSDDGGKTWEVNWITDQTRVSP
jgi:hypothetical protein